MRGFSAPFRSQMGTPTPRPRGLRQRPIAGDSLDRPQVWRVVVTDRLPLYRRLSASPTAPPRRGMGVEGYPPGLSPALIAATACLCRVCGTGRPSEGRPVAGLGWPTRTAGGCRCARFRPRERPRQDGPQLLN